jgi:hypothetical protein
MIASFPMNKVTSRLNGSGHYSLVLPNATSIYVSVFFYYNGHDCDGEETVALVTLTGPRVLNLIVPGLVIWNGTVVNVNGTPVSGLTIRGHSTGFHIDPIYGQYAYNGIRNIKTNAKGMFSVFVITDLNPFRMDFMPSNTSNYLPKTYTKLIINSTSYEIVVVLLTGSRLEGNYIYMFIHIYVCIHIYKNINLFIYICIYVYISILLI